MTTPFLALAQQRCENIFSQQTVSIDGQRTLIASNKKIEILDRTHGEVLVTLAGGHYHDYRWTQLSPNGHFVATLSSELAGTMLIIWDAERFEKIQNIRLEHADKIVSMSFNDWSSALILNYNDGDKKIIIFN
jgi:WD40 repeat protein